MSVTQAEEHGRAYEVALSGDITPNFLFARLYKITPDTTGRSVLMPDATKYKTGGPIGYVVNNGPDSITIKDSSGTAITLSTGTSVLATDTVALMMLADNSTSAGVWYGKVDSVGSIPNSGPAELIYVVGGIGTTTTTTEYNHQTDTHTTKSSSTNDHRSTHGATIGNAGYYVGGSTSSPYDKNEEYNPDTWTVKTDANFALRDAQSASANGKGYFYGGLDDSDGSQEYGSGTNAWITKTNKTTACISGNANSLTTTGSETFVFNGLTTSSPTSVVEKHTVGSDSWNSLASSPSPAVKDFSTFALASSIFKIGGVDASLVRDPGVNEYVVGSDAWISKLDFPDPSATEALNIEGCSGPEDKGHVLGGFSSGARDDVHRYSQAIDTWTVKTVLTSTRRDIQSSCQPIAP